MPIDESVIAKKAPAVVAPNAIMFHRGAVRGGRGYLLVDNRASGGALEELPTLTCAHCNCTTVLNPQRTRERGYCQKCHAYVCDLPGCRAACNPTELMVDLARKYPGEPWLLRGPNGEPLFPQELRDKERIY